MILPNLRGAIIGGSLLTVAIAMGEYTVASLMGFTTFSVYTYNIGTSTAYEGVALSFISFLFVWGAMLAVVPARPGRPQRGRRRDHGLGTRSACQPSSFVAFVGRSATSSRSTISTSTFTQASSCPCSARAAAARRRHCGSSPVSSGPTRARCSSTATTCSARPANKRNMGMVFQAYSLFPNMTAQQNVEFGLRVRKESREKRAQRARELLELVGLASAMSRYPRQLSGGQQQRVALARSLAIQPSVLLLDEPLSALDAKVRVQLREEVRRIQLELGITTLYVTHDQEEALSISDRVAVMSAGRVEQLGTPAEIYSGPRTAFVANFVGTMNKIEGTVVSTTDRIVRCGPVLLTVPDPAFNHPAGDNVELFVRPEDVSLALLSNGDKPAAGFFEGRVTSLTFLGPVTRGRPGD